MSISNRSPRPHGTKPVNVRQIRLLRRRTRLEWIWFALAVTGLALGCGIAATIQFHAKQVALAAAEADKNTVEPHASSNPADSTLAAHSSASVTPLRSIMTLAELDRSWEQTGNESEHYSPALDVHEIHEGVGSGDAVGPSPSEANVIETEQGRERDRGDLVPKVAQPNAPATQGIERDETPAGRSRPEQPLRYDLLVPLSGARGAPMLILLHGTGGARAVWNRWATAAQARGYIVCLPAASGTGAGDPRSGNRGDSRKRWADVDVPKLRNLAQQLVQTLKADGHRVYVFGYSNGGFFAHETGLRHPDVFSAVVSIGGGCNVWPISEEAKRVGVYLIHGTGDRVVPVEVARKSAERLRTAGVSNVILKEYPERGHEIFEEEMQAVFDWIEGLRE